MATADEYAAWIVKNQDKKGTPDFETVAKAYEEAKAQEASSGIPQGRRAPPSTATVALNAPYKALGGAADVFLNLPENLLALTKAGYGTLVTAAGRPDLAPEVTAPPQRVTQLLERKGFIQPTEGMTPAQRVLDVGLQAATGGLIGPGGAVRPLAAPAATGVLPALRASAQNVMGTPAAAGAVKGGIAGTAGQTVSEVTGEPLLGTAVSLATPAAITSAAQARQARLQAEQARNAVRDLTIRAGQEEGYVVTPGSVTPSGQNVLLERLAGKTRTQQEAAVRNQQVTDRLARRALGLPEGAPLERATTQQIRTEEFNRGYVPINNIGAVQTDQVFDAALNQILARYQGAGRSFPNAIPQPVQQLVDSFRVGQFNSQDAVQATRALREQSRANFAGGDQALGLAQRAVSNALEDQIERQLVQANNPNARAMLDQFRASRQRMAISHAVEDAIVEGGGSVNARKLANDLQTRGRYFSGDLDLIARFANVNRPVMVQPGTQGTPGAQTLLGGVGGLGGGYGGYAFGGGPGAIAGTMAGVYAPQLISAAARNYLLSGMGQRRAISNYESPVTNMLALPPLSPELQAAMIGLPAASAQPSP